MGAHANVSLDADGQVIGSKPRQRKGVCPDRLAPVGDVDNAPDVAPLHGSKTLDRLLSGRPLQQLPRHLFGVAQETGSRGVNRAGRNLDAGAQRGQTLGQRGVRVELSRFPFGARGGTDLAAATDDGVR